MRFNFCREHFNQKNIFLEKHQLYRYLISVQSVLRFAPSKNDTSCSVAGGMSGFINNNSYKILSEHKTFLVLLLWGLGKASMKKNVFFRALPELPNPPPPHDPNSGNLVLFFGRQNSRFESHLRTNVGWGGRYINNLKNS